MRCCFVALPGSFLSLSRTFVCAEMSNKQLLRDVVMRRLESAAEEIFALIEKAFAGYEAEIVRLKWEKVQQQQQGVQTPFLRPEAIPGEFAFSPLKDDVHESSFLHREPAEEIGQSQATPRRQEEAGCSLDLPTIPNEKLSSCSDMDDPGDWEDYSQETNSQKETSNGNGKKRRKRKPGPFDGGVTIKKEREDLDAFIQSGPFGGTVATPFSCSDLNGDSALPAQTYASCKPVSCPECGVRLHRQHSLERHISAVHRREKPFRCTVCEKRFARKTDCAIHMRVHTGERPYSCPVCERTFNVKNSLRRHLRLHTAQ